MAAAGARAPQTPEDSGSAAVLSSRNWEVQFRGERGQRGLAEWLTRPGLRLHDLVARERIEELLGRFRAQPLEEGRGYTVSMLLTLSAWLERHA